MLLRARHQRLHCGRHRRGCVEAQDHAAHITLVEDIRTDDFRHQWVAETLSGRDRLGWGGLFRRCQGDAGSSQHRCQVPWL